MCVCFDLGKMCTERGHVFDFQGHHPDLIPKGGSQQWKNALKYLEKDHFFKSNFGEDEEECQEHGENTWAKAISMETAEEFHQTLSQEEPKDYLRSFISINTYAKQRYQKPQAPYTSPYSLNDFPNTPQILKDYSNYTNSDEVINRPKTLIVISETRFGKTKWARAITPDHVHLRGEWNPDRIKDDCKLLIFDDLPMSELIPKDRWKSFFGMQDSMDIAGKYRSSRNINRGWKGFIYLTNTDPRLEVDENKSRYITLNSHIVTLESPLF